MTHKRKIGGYGWIPSLPDHRDKKYSAPSPILDKLPSKVDLRDKCPPVYNQEQLGSCTANAIGAAIQFDLRKQGLEDFIPSRLFIYYNEREMEGTVSEDAGAMIRDGIKSVNSLGTCKETTWPYNISAFRTKPDSNSYQEATAHTTVEYYRISRSIAQMRACLAEGYPFILGFSVYEGFETQGMANTGILNLPTRRERLLGGHAVLAVGYNDADQRFIVRNSWSDRWGQQGYFTMPYKYLVNQNLSDDFWQIKLVR